MEDSEVSRTAILVSAEISKIKSNPSLIKSGGCAACHVVSSVASEMHASEVVAGDLLAETLSQDPRLNEAFIFMVEDIHMRQRLMGVSFAMKTREAKDRYIEGNFKNGIDELLNDAAVYGTGVAVRKLVMEHIALQLAQNIGIDYHAASEELHYYMRKNDDRTHESIMGLVDSLIQKSGRGGR